MNRATRTTGLVLGFAAAGAAAAAALLGLLRTGAGNGAGREIERKRKSAAEPEGSSTALNLSGRRVYITDHGVRYHTADCLHLRGAVRAVPIEDAWDDHTPCAICNPLK